MKVKRLSTTAILTSALTKSSAVFTAIDLWLRSSHRFEGFVLD
jgi:hypothetical protein